jgi:hypothetical protein
MTNYWWIPVKSHLPDKDAPYLIFAESVDPDRPYIRIAWYDPKFGWSLLPIAWIDSITHWMPLPDFPLERDRRE